MIVMVIGVDVAAWPARESASHPSLLCRDAVGPGEAGEAQGRSRQPREWKRQPMVDGGGSWNPHG